jgi:hypothetical protein
VEVSDEAADAVGKRIARNQARLFPERRGLRSVTHLVRLDPEITLVLIPPCVDVYAAVPVTRGTR